MLNSSLCNIIYINDLYVLVKGRIAVLGAGATAAARQADTIDNE